MNIIEQRLKELEAVPEYRESERLFLKLQADPNYYRIDLAEAYACHPYGLITFFKRGYAPLCERISGYLSETYKTEVVWGLGRAVKYEVPFSNNHGYYLFFKIPNGQDGRCIESEVRSWLKAQPEEWDYLSAVTEQAQNQLIKASGGKVKGEH